VTSARRDRNGHLVPWVVDYFNGVEEVERMRARGLSVEMTTTEVHALGVAIAEQREGRGHAVGLDPDPVLSPAASQALDAIVARRAAHGPGSGSGPDRSTSVKSDIPNVGNSDGREQAQVDPWLSEAEERHVRNAKIEIRDHSDEGP
jgi:hypothetical protein